MTSPDMTGDQPRGEASGSAKATASDEARSLSSDDLRQVIEEQAQALGPVLYAGMATSVTAAAPRLGASQHSEALKHTKFPHLLPMLVRAQMREYLEDNALPNDWQVRGNSKLMAQLNLTHDELNMRMAFLKERRRTYPGGVPVAGRNDARRERWTNPPLDLDLSAPAIRRGFQHKPLDLLLLWDFTSATALDQFHLRIAHTLHPGVYGRAVPCDLLLDVQAGGTIHTRLRFTGSSEEEDLFNLNIAKDENSGS